jgi:hypothetical protein
MPCRDSDVVMAGTKVDLRVDGRITKLVNEVANEQDWIAIFLHDLVESSVVNTQSQQAIFFLHKDHWSASWGI